MAWFGKKDKPPQREHDRYAGKGEKVEILINNAESGKPYELLDVSMGGFALTGYDGNLHGNQYFEFKFCGETKGTPAEITGFANIVRVKEGMLAAKFTPQPLLKTFFRDYIQAS